MPDHPFKIDFAILLSVLEQDLGKNEFIKHNIHSTSAHKNRWEVIQWNLTLQRLQNNSKMLSNVAEETPSSPLSLKDMFMQDQWAFDG